MLYIFNYYLLERGHKKVVDCRALRKEEIDGKKKITNEKVQNILNRSRRKIGQQDQMKSVFQDGKTLVDNKITY